MKKRAKLTQEQLKAVLQGWKTTLLACCVWDIGEHLSDEHVYTQIEELIESGEDSYIAAWMDKCHELEMEVAELREKTTVTREWARKFVADFPIWTDDGDVWRGEVEFVITKLKELGIAVETTH